MRQEALSLNTLLSWVVAALAVLVLCTCASIFLATSQLRHVSATIDEAVQSVHSAEEAALELLIFDRGALPRERQAAERLLRERLSDARRYVSSPVEAGVLAEATSAVDDYLAISFQSPRDPARAAPFRRSYDAIRRLVEINLAQARDSQLYAGRIDRIAEALGLALGLLVLLTLGALVFWLRTRAFAGVFTLGRAMDRFEADDRDARAPETGPLELREMARRFNRMADTISRRRQQQIAFLAGVAHDLRNPLAALRTSLAVLRPDRPLPPEPTIRRIAELMDRQFEHLERMTGDFIDTARIEAGELELRPEPRDLGAIVRHAVSLFQSAPLDERFRLSIPDEPIVVACDAARLHQVVTNLLSNAMKYSSEASTIDVALVAQSDHVALSVSDRGIGIASDELRTIFDPFRRSEASRKTAAGVGLGLYVARRIVRAHGGRIEVETVPGSGSTFRVVLPRAARARQPAWEAESARAEESQQDVLS